MVPGAYPYAWTVEDINKANDWAEFWWTLNTHANNTIEVHGDSATIHGCRYGNCLDVHFALPAPTEFPRSHALEVTQDIARCGAYTYVTDPERQMSFYKQPDGYYPPEWPVLERPRLVGKVAGYNGRFMSLMLPRRKDEQPAQVVRLDSLDNTLAVRITFAAVEDTLIWAYEHTLLEAGGIYARGQWCQVRRDRATGEVVASAVAGADAAFISQGVAV